MFRRWKRLWARSRPLALGHLMLRAAVVCLGLWKLSRGRWDHAGLCLLTLALFSLPALGERALKLRSDPPLDTAVVCFAVCANVCGEVLGFYLRFPWWDAMLHVIWGFLAGLLGCAFLEALQGTRPRPGAAAFAALGFSALVAVVWEFFEYAMDRLFPWDMQKDAWMQGVHSVLLNPEGKNEAVAVAAEAVTVDGVPWPGLLDPGLRDTISDLFLNFVGALLAAVALWFCLRRGRLPRLLRGLMPAPVSKTEVSDEKR